MATQTTFSRSVAIRRRIVALVRSPNAQPSGFGGDGGAVSQTYTTKAADNSTVVLRGSVVSSLRRLFRLC